MILASIQLTISRRFQTKLIQCSHSNSGAPVSAPSSRSFFSHTRDTIQCSLCEFNITDCYMLIQHFTTGSSSQCHLYLLRILQRLAFPDQILRSLFWCVPWIMIRIEHKEQESEIDQKIVV